MIEQVHHIEGRTRFRVEGLYRSDPLKKFIESRLSAKPEVISASANPLTGRLLLRYNSGNTPEKMAAIVRKAVLEYRKITGTSNSARAFNGGNADLSGRHPETVNRDSRIRKLSKLISGAEQQKMEPWHLIPADEILEMMNTRQDSGLSKDVAKRMLQKYGPNKLPELQKASQFGMFASQFKTLPVGLLAIAAGLSVATGGMIDAVLIMGVVAVNASIGYLTESKAERTISSLKTLVKPSGRVIRDGKEISIPADQLVPGDLLVLKPGSYITADSRVVDAQHLSVDESALTGESMPSDKSVEPLSGDSIPLADRSNMVYMGTLVTGGQGLGVVVATGKFTEIGRLQEMVGGAQTPLTPLEKQLQHVGNQLVLVSGGICALVFGIGMLRGYALVQMFRTAISLAAAAVPEGLPAVATTTQAFGMNNLRRHHVLIRKLRAVETLGSVQTICLDKTGTITLNEMTVKTIYSGMKRIDIRNGKFKLEDESINPLQHNELIRLMHVCVLCSETRLGTDSEENGKKNQKYILTGSPTENALVRVALNAGIDVKKLRREHPLLHVTHRSENRLFMSTLHEAEGKGRFIALKGSPGEVLDMCELQLKDGKQVLLTDQDKELIQHENEKMAGDALRVLGMAYANHEVSEDQSIRESNFIWLGLAGMADPVREGVSDLIGVFHQAGIKTIMLTGDQSPTAYAVAKELNLSEGQHVQILESSYLEEMDPDKLQALVQRVHVFARISPSHKLQIVQSLQRAGQVIAMTGDGINDSPALKSADIGVAMGNAGTDIAREVADVVLEKDDLETMVIAIEGGRSIYENIRKAVHFLVATNLSEIMVTFVGITAGMGHPLNTMQLLWINTISDIFPALALSMAPAEPGLMKQPPRDPEKRIIGNRNLKRMVFESAIISAGAIGAYGYGILRYGIGPRAGTLVFQGLTLGQLLHTISCRSETHTIFDSGALPSNRFLQLALASSLVVQALTMFIPGLRKLLGITAINVFDAAVIGSSAVLPFIINESTKNAIYPISTSGKEGAAS